MNTATSSPSLQFLGIVIGDPSSMLVVCEKTLGGDLLTHLRKFGAVMDNREKLLYLVEVLNPTVLYPYYCTVLFHYYRGAWHERAIFPFSKPQGGTVISVTVTYLSGGCWIEFPALEADRSWKNRGPQLPHHRHWPHHDHRPR